MNKTKLQVAKPYWALIPQLAKMHNLECVHDSSGDAELCLAPNNPDGYVPDLLALEEKAKTNNKLFIHDGRTILHRIWIMIYQSG